MMATNEQISTWFGIIHAKAVKKIAFEKDGSQEVAEIASAALNIAEALVIAINRIAFGDKPR